MSCIMEVSFCWDTEISFMVLNISKATLILEMLPYIISEMEGPDAIIWWVRKQFEA